MPETAETPAAVLRRAADKIRQHVASVEADIVANPYWSSAEHPPHDYPNLYARGVDNGLGGPAGMYAAAMGPTVGTALADWLNYEARITDNFVASGGTDHFDSLFTERPLAVALAVLGETAPAAPSDANPRSAR